MSCINLVGGKCLIRYKRYTYGTHCRLKHGDRWRCNQYVQTGCKAHLVLDERLNVLKKNDVHHHAPPLYLRRIDGLYAKVEKGPNISAIPVSYLKAAYKDYVKKVSEMTRTR